VEWIVVTRVAEFAPEAYHWVLKLVARLWRVSLARWVYNTKASTPCAVETGLVLAASSKTSPDKLLRFFLGLSCRLLDAGQIEVGPAAAMAPKESYIINTKIFSSLGVIRKLLQLQRFKSFVNSCHIGDIIDI